MTTALLVTDMQSFFAPMLKSTSPNVTTLISHFRSHSLPIIFTQHGHPVSELTPPYPNQLVRKWGPDGSIRRGSTDWAFLPAISKAVDDLGAAAAVVQKTTYDAFIGTELAKTLEAQGVQRVVCCGVMTDCCVDTTARSAFNRGWETWVVRDACGSADRTQHEAGLQAFGFAFGEVVTTAEVVARVGNG